MLLSPGGHCAFVARYRVGGRLRRFTIGPFSRLSLGEARQKASDAIHDSEHGVDQAAMKIAGRAAETFADLAAQYVELHAKKKRSGREDIRILYGSAHKRPTGKRPHIPLVKRWGARKLTEIKRRDVRELLDQIAARAPIMANRVLAVVRKMFNFAIAHDWIEANPCQMLARPSPEKQRDRVLTEDEIRNLWKSLDDEQSKIAALFTF